MQRIQAALAVGDERELLAGRRVERLRDGLGVLLRAGADLVQIYTGFIYEGPGLPLTIARGLVKRMKEERASSLSELAPSS